MSEQLDIFGSNIGDLSKKCNELDLSSFGESDLKDFFKKLSLELSASAVNRINCKSSSRDIKTAMETVSEALKTIHLAEKINSNDDDDIPVVTVTIKNGS